jgi:hypothetical protein
VQRLLARADERAKRLGKPIRLWMSDKQDAFVTGIAAEFPDVPHRYCQNHFLRDLAKPLLEKDSHQKVQMRKKVRGLRDIEKQVLEDRRKAQAEAPVSPASTAAAAATGGPVADAVTAAAAGAVGGHTAVAGVAQAVSPQTAGAPTAAASPALLQPRADEAGQVVLDYCAAVRGILNDDQGGPLQPPGLRMASALQEVRESLQRNLEAKKGGAVRSSCASSRAASRGDCKRSPLSKSRSKSTSRS